MKRIPTSARYATATKTIRSVPENYWLASMDSWDGAVDHDAAALVMAASFDMLAALRAVREAYPDGWSVEQAMLAVDAAIAKTEVR